MKKHLTLLLAFITLYGCGSLMNYDPLIRDKIIINKVDSRFGKIGFVSLATINTELLIYGVIKRRVSTTKPVYGHVHIDVFGEDNMPMAMLTSSHKRLSYQAQKTRFRKILDMDLKKIRTISVSHHSERHNHS